MDGFTLYLAILFALITSQNYILSQFLGLCPFIGVSKRLSSAFGMSMAVIFVMTMASLVTSIIYIFILKPLQIEEILQTIAFILVIASLVQFIEMVIIKKSPALYRALGIFLPLITTNCAVLGVTVLNITNFSEAVESGKISAASYIGRSTFMGFAAGVGFFVAIMLMAGIRERLETANLPECLKGVPIALICAGMMALAFGGFAGLVKI